MPGWFIHFLPYFSNVKDQMKKGEKGSKKVPHGVLGRGGWGAGFKANWTMAIFNPIDLSGLLEHIQI